MTPRPLLHSTPRSSAVRLGTALAAACTGLVLVAAPGSTSAAPVPPAPGAPAADVAAGAAVASGASAAGRVVYVSRRGDDGARGSKRAPLRTIGAAVGRAGDGGTVVVRSGVYRESVVVEGVRDLTIRAAAGADVVLDGSRPVAGWQPEAGGWVRRGWTAEFDSSPTYTWGAEDNDGDWSFVSPEHPMAAHPDQVWVDGRALVQVGRLEQLRPGTFYVDDRGDALHLGTDPTGRLVEASVLDKALSIRAEGTTVSGVDVRRYASSVPHMGSVTVESPGGRLSDMRITENATTGLFVMEQGTVLSRLRIDRNGLMGLAASGARRLVVDRVRVLRNNREHFNPSPSAGGAKITRSQDVTVRRSTFRRNEGTGLWLDESVYGITLGRNRMLDNTMHGLFLELSGKVLAVGNVFARNGANGVKVNDTNDVRLWNNTFAGNRDELAILQDDRDLDPQGSYLDHSLPLTFRNGPAELRNNLFEATSASSQCLLCVIDYTGRFSADQMGITAQSNLYRRPVGGRPPTPVQWAAGDDTLRFGSLPEFARATGQEQAAKVVLGRALVGSDLRPSAAVVRLAATVAAPLPADVAALLGVASGERRLGAR